MASKDYAQLAKMVVELVGGKNNVVKAFHCVTRLRFNLRDETKADEEGLKATEGVLGIAHAGGQFQVIIGPDVENVYNEVVEVLGVNPEMAIEENLDAKKPLTPKAVGSAILDGLTGSLVPIIPAIVACAFFKMLASLLGPDMFNVISTESSLYTVFTFVGDAGFYFFPVLIGWSAAKKFNVMPVLGILLGCIMMHPTFVGMVDQPFDVFGIPCDVQNYSSTVLPIIVSVWVMSYVAKFFDRVLPSSIRSVFSPAFTILVMLPITLCIVGPAGAFLGNYVVALLLGIGNISGVLGVVVIAALYPFLVMTGMHMVLIAAMFQIWAAQGFDGLASPACAVEACAIMGVCIGAMLRIRNREQKSLAAEFAATAVLAGTSEPCLYGICMRYRRPFIGLVAGSAIGALYIGITGAYSATMIPSTNFLTLLNFVGASNANLINGVIGCAIGLVVAAAITFFFGFAKDDPALQKE
ncbi:MULTISPECIES: PTS transporter subunit EIIC [Collinsella]|uniref:PTS transporter subunit EIIC n=1 Tax=Collinsella TaxID=102106 RepID=UPI000B3AC19A|nr:MULTISPECIES: PTS transporter subunit EIIC [Collinsella]MBM6908337.1 PTS transporter subunit EIIC [Collinsella intestinalis]MBM6942220.1 PTS transporter subunit EIIC [Collinsella intestinalis]OUO64053.1 PTS fructose transporter subunit IIB [Collinsella sp. An268]